jgi:branched-subunit amino acid aminotransferase/4-amino-4-deoxychorismate lyase
MTGDLALFESILWEPGAGYFLLERHLARLARSADAFGLPFLAPDARARLLAHAARLPGRRKVRLLLTADGGLHVEDTDLKPSTPVRLALAAAPVDSADPLLRHKTSRRGVYERALAARPGADDVLLWNRRRELTESCTANLVVDLGGRRLTPHADAGLLPGTFRAELLARGEIEEARLGLDDLDAAARLFLINSVRRWCEARLVR